MRSIQTIQQLLWLLLLAPMALGQVNKAIALKRAQVKTTNYTLVAGDSGKTIAFDCSSACTATLTPASKLKPSFNIRLVCFGAGTVTISSSSTINGGATLLKGGHAEISSDGSAFYSATTKHYAFTMNSVQAGDTLTRPAEKSSFATTHTLPASLPAGTYVQLTYGGFYNTAAEAGNTIYVFTGPGGTGTSLCHGEQLTTTFANGNRGSAPWEEFCHFTVRTRGASGSLFGMTRSHRWYGDTSFAAKKGGPGYPGYDSIGTQPLPFGFSNVSAGQVFDTTKSVSLFITFLNASPKTTWYLAEYTMEITLP
jgi:hypothetical protein